MGIDDQKGSVHHFHDSFHFATEIGVARRIDDINPITVPLERGVFCANRNSFFALEVHRIHHPFLDFLVGTKSTGLAQQLIDQCGLTVINVRNDGNVTNLVHGTGFPRSEGGEYGRSLPPRQLKDAVRIGGEHERTLLNHWKRRFAPSRLGSSSLGNGHA